MARTKNELKFLQSLPLEIKVAKTELRIREFVEMYGVDGCYIAFSGGKDSRVLLHIVRRLYPNLMALFVNTGLEYPEIQKFAMSFENVTTIRPKMRFDEVIKKYGYPIISKEVAKCVSSARRLDSKYGDVCRARLNGTHLQASGKPSLYNCSKYKPLLDVDFEISERCCYVMKKAPSHDFTKKTGRNPITAQMASESRLREQQWIQHGCNMFDNGIPTSNPMSFWTTQDVLAYAKYVIQPEIDSVWQKAIHGKGRTRKRARKYLKKIGYTRTALASVYGDIVYKEEPDQIRWEQFASSSELKTTGCQRTGCIFCGFGCHLEDKPNRFQKDKQTHPKQYAYCIGGGGYNEDGIWQPNKKGLGMGHVFDVLNEIYGDDFIPYDTCEVEEC